MQFGDVGLTARSFHQSNVTEEEEKTKQTTGNTTRSHQTKYFVWIALLLPTCFDGKVLERQNNNKTNLSYILYKLKYEK